MLNKVYKRIFLCFVILLIAACSDNDTSSDNSESQSQGETITTNDLSATLSQRSVEVNDTFTLSYTLSTTTSQQARSKAAATIHWGDNTGDRISGSGEIQHTYTSAGSFSINIQVDDGALTRLGRITVTNAATATSNRFSFSAPSGGTAFVVPGGITSIAVIAVGASGQDGRLYGVTSNGGEGGTSRAKITVTPGETLTLIVGGTDGTGGGGGRGSGGNAGGGGGRSAIERAGIPLIVAGGGGGAGSSHLCGNGGDGGGASGGNGPSSGGNTGGRGGSGGTGGAGGATIISSVGSTGTATNGGRGGNGTNGGGGGGGGYGGGGGGGGGGGIGGACGGGGGGFAPGGTTTAGGNVGNGRLTLVLN